MFLSGLKPGGRFRIDKVLAAGEVGKRLADMGFVAGVEGKMLRKAHFGDPIEVSILDYHVSIRKSEAAAIAVKALPDVPLPSEKKVLRLGLAGNPNSGKTTLFNAITGARQKVSNYAGVTVEKKEGRRTHRGIEFVVYDLPGTYSLTAYSMDEVIARDFILNERPDVLVDVIDSTNLERNLFLCAQFQELGIPVVGALNLTDEAESSGIRVNDRELSDILGLPLVKTSGKKGLGVEALLDAARKLASEGGRPVRRIDYGTEVEAEIAKLTALLEKDAAFRARYPVRWIAVKLLEKDAQAAEKIRDHPLFAELRGLADSCVRRLESHFGRDSEIVMSEQRYAHVHGAVAQTVTRTSGHRYETTRIVDNVLLNRLFGLPLFFLILWAIFQITFTAGAYPVSWLERLFSWLSQWAGHALPEGILRSLAVDGVIGGVGGVLSFVPLIVILFALVSFLEDSGYMARSAFLMDRFLHFFGLHGQSFLPMMIGFGCSVPAIMAARTLKNQRDRIITVLITPFMSCGAKLPVYVLLAGAFFPRHAGNVIMAIYLLGVVLGLFTSLLLRKTVLSGNATPFVMELPPYRLPTLRGMGWHVWDKTSHYLRKAGTVLLAASLLIWTLTAFPRAGKGVDNEARLKHSFAGMLGQGLEPLLSPLGFDWKIGISVVTGFAAKEAVVSTLGVLYKTGADQGGKSASLRSALKDDPVFSPLLAFILMLFTLVAPPCIAALSAIYSEISGRWLAVGVVYSVGLAWVLGFIVYQAGSALGF